jgi:glycosyltransferase involved in cell wall biosynthesis
MNPPDLSLVVPVRDEAGNIGPLVDEIRTRLDAAGLAWEAVLVDDGSTDGSWTEITAAAADGRIQGIRHESGQGKSAALMTGFARTRGRAVAMLDGDGQDDPAELPRMVGLLGDGPDGVGLVNGWKTPRLDPWHKTFPSRVFNLIVGWVTGLRLHDHNCGLKVFRGDVARRLTLGLDMHRFIPVLVARAGHRVVETPVRHRPRVRVACWAGSAPSRASIGSPSKSGWPTSTWPPNSPPTPGSMPPPSGSGSSGPNGSCGPSSRATTAAAGRPSGRWWSGARSPSKTS